MIRAFRVYRENNCRLIRRVIRSCGAIKSNDEPIKYLWNRMQARERALTPVFPPSGYTMFTPRQPPPLSLESRALRPSHKYTYCTVASRRARLSPKSPIAPLPNIVLDRDHSGSFFARCLVQRGPWDRKNRSPKIPFAGGMQVNQFTPFGI